MILFCADWFFIYQIGAPRDHNLQHKWILPAIIKWVKFSNLSWILGSSASYYKRWRGPALLDEEADRLTSHPSPGNYSLSSLHKISEHDRLIKKQLTKYRVLISTVLYLTRKTTYSITYHIIPDTSPLLDKKPLLQNDKVPNTLESTKGWDPSLQAVNASTEGITSQTRVDDIICSGSKTLHCNKSALAGGSALWK